MSLLKCHDCGKLVATCFAMHNCKPKAGSSNPDIITETAERILSRMFRRRLPLYADKLALPSWIWIRCGDKSPQKPREIILDLLRNERRVTAGYTATGVRGFREYYILYK